MTCTFKRRDLAAPDIDYAKYLLRHSIGVWDVAPNSAPVAVWTPWEASCVYAYINQLEGDEEDEQTI